MYIKLLAVNYPTSCQELEEQQPVEDGLYWLTMRNVDGTISNAPIYCHNMTSSPAEYVPLVAGTETNYAYYPNEKRTCATSCTECENYYVDTKVHGGKTEFSKIRLNVQVNTIEQ